MKPNSGGSASNASICSGRRRAGKRQTFRRRSFFDHEKGKLGLFELMDVLGLFELMDVKEFAARILGRKTDIMTRNSLHPRLKKRIEHSAVLVF
jgi:hypothetical protein